MNMAKISIVIPCYNSEKMIKTVVDEAINTVISHGGYDYEIILVNDCSPDNVLGVIADMAAQNPRIKGIDLAKNFGQHSAIMAGFHYVTGDIAICLDDDGQTPPCEMFKLIDKLSDYDLVFAEYSEKKHSPLRNFGSKINDIMARWLIDKPKNLKIMSYFACKRFVIDEVIKYDNPYPYISGLLLLATKRVCNVRINHQKRIDGSSGYTFKKLLFLWVNGFTAFSVKPLRIATIIGGITAILGFIYGVVIIINKLIHPFVPLGYSSTMAVLLFLGGMIMLLLGFIGEYIGRIYISINNAPQFVVRQSINTEDNANDNKQ